MIPMWMFGVGDRLPATPSSSSRRERDPSVPVRLAELMLEAGLPEGVLQVVHGDKEMVDAILDHPAIARGELRRLVRHRALRLFARRRRTASACRRWAAPRTTASSCPTPTSTRRSTTCPARRSARRASAAWRCRWWCRWARRPPTRCASKLVPAIAALRVGVSTDPEAHYGPVVTAAHKAQGRGLHPDGVDEGAELVVDGRGFALQGHEKGFFLGPTPVRPRDRRT